MSAEVGAEVETRAETKRAPIVHPCTGESVIEAFEAQWRAKRKGDLCELRRGEM